MGNFWDWLLGVLLALMAALHPYAAAGAAFGCCFFLAYPSASRGYKRALFVVFSWGIGYGAGVFWFGEGPPFSQKALLISATFAAVAVLLFMAAGSVMKKGGALPPWAQDLLDIIFPYRKKRGPEDGN
jgi:hypothetical protein